MKKSGFTLLEILLSLAIFSILIWIIFSSYSKIQSIKKWIESKQLLVEYSNDLFEDINRYSRDYVLDSWSTDTELHLCEYPCNSIWNHAIQYRLSWTKVEILKLVNNWSDWQWDINEWFNCWLDYKNCRTWYKHADKRDNLVVENLEFVVRTWNANTWIDIVDMYITTRIWDNTVFYLTNSVSFKSKHYNDELIMKQKLSQ